MKSTRFQKLLSSLKTLTADQSQSVVDNLRKYHHNPILNNLEKELAESRSAQNVIQFLLFAMAKPMAGSVIAARPAYGLLCAPMVLNFFVCIIMTNG